MKADQILLKKTTMVVLSILVCLFTKSALADSIKTELLQACSDAFSDDSDALNSCRKKIGTPRLTTAVIWACAESTRKTQNKGWGIGISVFGNRSETEVASACLDFASSAMIEPNVHSRGGINKLDANRIQACAELTVKNSGDFLGCLREARNHRFTVDKIQYCSNATAELGLPDGIYPGIGDRHRAEFLGTCIKSFGQLPMLSITNHKDCVRYSPVRTIGRIKEFCVNAVGTESRIEPDKIRVCLTSSVADHLNEATYHQRVPKADQNLGTYLSSCLCEGIEQCQVPALANLLQRTQYGDRKN